MNLTAAARMLVLDVHWNPVHVAQVGRVTRAACLTATRLPSVQRLPARTLPAAALLRSVRPGGAASGPQVVARIFRFGQRRPTWVYHLLYAASVEERVYERCMDKVELSNRVRRAWLAGCGGDRDPGLGWPCKGWAAFPCAQHILFRAPVQVVDLLDVRKKAPPRRMEEWTWEYDKPTCMALDKARAELKLLAGGGRRHGYKAGVEAVVL